MSGRLQPEPGKVWCSTAGCTPDPADQKIQASTCGRVVDAVGPAAGNEDGLGDEGVQAGQRRLGRALRLGRAAQQAQQVSRAGAGRVHAQAGGEGRHPEPPRGRLEAGRAQALAQQVPDTLCPDYSRIT